MRRSSASPPLTEPLLPAIVALLRGNKIYTACVGDSRCVKGTAGAKWTATDLSEDQKPDDPKEKVARPPDELMMRRKKARGPAHPCITLQARIESCGGYVSAASELYGPARVWRGGFGIGPGLAMSRSLGDHGVAEVGVTADPEIVEADITDQDSVLILASDGVWEFISSEEAVLICQTKHPNATAATKAGHANTPHLKTQRSPLSQ